MDLKGFIIEYDNILKHLEETTPERYVRHPDGAYGWDNVARYQEMNARLKAERKSDIHKRALELVTAWAKATVNEDKRRNYEHNE